MKLILTLSIGVVLLLASLLVVVQTRTGESTSTSIGSVGDGNTQSATGDPNFKSLDEIELELLT